MNNAIKKATEYCLNCRVKPCSIKGCPLNNNIPAFIKLVKEENKRKVYLIKFYQKLQYYQLFVEEFVLTKNNVKEVA